MRVLLVAPACNASDIGEAWVGFQWAKRLSGRHELTVLTYRKRDKESVRHELPAAQVVEWVEPPLLGKFERLNSLLKPAYIPFYHHSRRWLVREGSSRFDVGLQVLPVAMRYPSPFVGLGLPYVLGPVGGGLSDPPGFESEDTAPWYVQLRRVDGWRLRHDRLLRRSYTDATCVLGIADYVRDRLVDVPVKRFEVMSETALESVPDPVDRSGRSEAPVRLLFVGRLIRTKGVRDAIRALTHLRDLPVVFDVVGEGFDRVACEALAADSNLGDRVFFHGRQPRAEVDGFYRSADVFLFPSYREPGGNVPFEALGMGLPVITCDRGGPASIVDASCGFLVPAISPAQFAEGLADAIRVLVENRELRGRMSLAARERALVTGTWDRRVMQMEAVLEDVARP